MFKNSIKIQNLKFIILIIVLASTIISALPAHAEPTGLVTCGLRSDDPNSTTLKNECTECDIILLVKTVIDFLTLKVTPVLAFLLIVLSGAIIVLGGARPEMVSKGKSMLTNTIIAVIIIYGSFIVVTFVLKALAGDKNVSETWYLIECDRTKSPSTGSTTPVGDPQRSPSLPVSTGEGGPGGPNTATPPGAFTPAGFRNGLSPGLEKLQACMTEKFGTSIIRTSTTDNNIAKGKCDPLDPNERFKDKANNCSHAKNSCHYGGSEPACQKYGSYAMDYVTNDRSVSYNQIQNVALQCDPNVVSFVENVGTTNEHVHISIGQAYGCGCN